MTSVIVMTMMTLHAQDYIGVQLGYARSITRLNTPENGKTLSATGYNGLKVGVVYDATIVKGFGATIGLNYTFGANSTDWVKVNSSQPGNYPQKPPRG